MSTEVEFGQCIVHRRDVGDDGYELHIERADPHILITIGLLAQAVCEPTPSFWLHFTEQQLCYQDHTHDRLRCFALRSVLHIKDANREVLYRITPHPGRSDIFEGHWPD